MNNQYLQFVREQLMIATADLSGSTKGQLEVWQENALFDTGRYRRKKIRYRDEVTGKMITRDNPRSRVNNHWRKAHQLPWSVRLSFRHHHGDAPFCLLKNIIKPGCCGVTAVAFAGSIRSR